MFLALIGITLGYHRYFTHRAFKASAWQEVVMLYLGLLCGCRSALGWAGVHRMHHAYADTPLDPHSAKYQPWWRILFSLWSVKIVPLKFVKNLLRNKRVMFFHKYGVYIFITHQIVFFAIFGINSIIVHSIVFLLSYVGFGVVNLWGHGLTGPVNRVWINLIAPLEGNHADHHRNSTR
jgi:stearoyl-CoA desaturase (delta-9 desaturase)